MGKNEVFLGVQGIPPGACQLLKKVGKCALHGKFSFDFEIL